MQTPFRLHLQHKEGLCRRQETRVKWQESSWQHSILLLPKVDFMWLIHGKNIHFNATSRIWMTAKDLNHLFVTERPIPCLHLPCPEGTLQLSPAGQPALLSADLHGHTTWWSTTHPCKPVYLAISATNCCLKGCIRANPQMTLALCLFKDWNRNKLVVSCTRDKGQGHFRGSCSEHRHNSNLN